MCESNGNGNEMISEIIEEVILINDWYSMILVLIWLILCVYIDIIINGNVCVW